MNLIKKEIIMDRVFGSNLDNIVSQDRLFDIVSNFKEIKKNNTKKLHIKYKIGVVGFDSPTTGIETILEIEFLCDLPFPLEINSCEEIFMSALDIGYNHLFEYLQNKYSEYHDFLNSRSSSREFCQSHLLNISTYISNNLV